MKRAVFIILLVLLVDQASKIWVKTSFYYGEEIFVLGEWFRLHFLENSGMAFGMEFNVSYGKLILSLFRLIAIGAIGWYLYSLTKSNTPKGLIVCISLIFAGAIGNMIDSAFYGMIFSESYPYTGEVATLLPAGGGYSSFLHGKVVDMLYFPLFSGRFPAWLPLWGGDYFTFFQPVFNLADSSITIGVTLLILFQKRFFPKEETPAATPQDSDLPT